MGGEQQVTSMALSRDYFALFFKRQTAKSPSLA
jgi:hypothetical protein